VAKERDAYPHLMRWFNHVSSLPQFTSVWGKVFLCESPMKAAQQASVPTKKEATKKDAPKKEAPKK